MCPREKRAVSSYRDRLNGEMRRKENIEERREGRREERRRKIHESRKMMCEESLLLAQKTIKNLRPGDDHNKLDIMFDLGQCCVYTNRHSMGIKNIQEFMDFYCDKMKPEPMFDQQKFTLTILLAESYMYQKEYSKAVEQFEIFHKLCQTAIPCEENKPGLGRVFDTTTIITYADHHQVLISRSYGHLAHCLKELDLELEYEAAKALEKCLGSYWLENVNLEGLQVDEFQYYALILMSIVSYQYNQKEYLKKFSCTLIKFSLHVLQRGKRSKSPKILGKVNNM